jgi:glycosyltransferase involved in cell wall biosynthesis
VPDIVDHQRTGYLAQAFETEDLAAGIRWVLGQDLRQASRERAVVRFSNAVVAEQYRTVYKQALSAQSSGLIQMAQSSLVRSE